MIHGSKDYFRPRNSNNTEDYKFQESRYFVGNCSITPPWGSRVVSFFRRPVKKIISGLGALTVERVLLSFVNSPDRSRSRPSFYLSPSFSQTFTTL